MEDLKSIITRLDAIVQSNTSSVSYPALQAIVRDLSDNAGVPHPRSTAPQPPVRHPQPAKPATPPAAPHPQPTDKPRFPFFRPEPAHKEPNPPVHRDPDPFEE